MKLYAANYPYSQLAVRFPYKAILHVLIEDGQ